MRNRNRPPIVWFFLNGNYDVAAGVKQQLELDAQNNKGLRLLPGRFMVIEQAMGQPRNVSQRAHETLVNFVAEMKSKGFIRDSLARHKIEGATVAP